MIGALVHQLTRNLNDEQIRTAGFDTYFVDHTTGVYPQFASGYPWSASTMQVTGDIIADLTEDMAAEQKARLTYDNILRLSDDPDVSNVIRFLREREIVHFQRFGDANHTRLSRFYPLWAAARRGYLDNLQPGTEHSAISWTKASSASGHPPIAVRTRLISQGDFLFSSNSLSSVKSSGEFIELLLK